MSTDVNQLFARAEAAFGQRRATEARGDLLLLRRLVGEHPAVLHLLALVERDLGRTEDAEAAFRAALRVAPDDPQINNNYALLLDERGDSAGALRHYTNALRRPGFADAHLNRALLHERAGRLDHAEADARAAVAAAPANPAAYTALGTVLRAAKRLDGAATAFDTALSLAPARPRALHGRARVALERGEAIATSLYRRVLATMPDDRDAVLGLAAALEAEGNVEGASLLESALAAQPDWVDGHRELIRMRSEAGDDASITRTLDAALATTPRNLALHLLKWDTLVQAGRHEEALDAIRGSTARATLPRTAEVRLAEAICLDELDGDEAGRLFDELDHADPAVAVAHGRHLLRAGSVERAARVLETALSRDPTDMAIWAHVELAWRRSDDPRHEWLSGDPALIGSSTLDFDDASLSTLAECLRHLHRSRAHPIGQSLRGGTQTRGALLERVDPILRRLRARLETAVARYVEALPPFDPAHPLLRHRNGSPAIVGSWSVRLSASGFHVSHIHPLGTLSSACHVGLPDAGAGGDRAGWLEIGVPPATLRLDLPPIASIEPRPGRLTLFPSYLFHGTRPFADGERLSVAFDVTLR